MQSETRKSRSVAAVLATTLAMTACGGGGGGGGMQSLASRDVYAADPGATKEAVGKASASLPRFGSVTQSANVNVAGVSTDAAQMTLDGGGIALTVTREDGTSFSLNSNQHELLSVRTPASETFLGDGVTEAMINVADDATTLAAVSAQWSPGYGEWLAAGTWIHLEGDIAGGSVSGVEVGAFMDGPELGGRTVLPSGTATYSGEANGLYAGRFGTDAQVPRGSLTIGDYEGDLALTADFGGGTVEGHVDNILIDGFVVTPSGTVTDDTGATNYRAALGSVPINSDGSFSGKTVRITNPDWSIVSSEGAWGGMFSNIDDSNGNPRLVGGTHGGAFTTAGGSEFEFLGVFYGATEEAFPQQ